MVGNVLGGRGFTQERRLPLQIRENNRDAALEVGSGQRQSLKNGFAYTALNKQLEETWKAGSLTRPSVQKQYPLLHEM